MLFFWVCFGLFNLCLMAGFEAKENRRIKRTAGNAAMCLFLLINLFFKAIRLTSLFA